MATEPASITVRTLPWAQLLSPLRKIPFVSGVIVCEHDGRVLSAMIKGKTDSELVRKVAETIHQLVSVLSLHGVLSNQFTLSYADASLCFRRLGSHIAAVKLTGAANIEQKATQVFGALEDLQAALAELQS